METLPLCWLCMLKALLLLTIANGAPVLARNVLGARFAWPVDHGVSMADQRRLFGSSKTWRGVFASVLTTTVAAPVCSLSFLAGASLGLLAMVGDLCSSFIKRRLGYRESSRFRILDVVPESLLPILILQEPLNLTIIETGITVALFFIMEALLSPILFRLHIRDRPY